MNNSSFNHYLTTKEVSQVLDVSISTIYKYVANKKIIPIKKGGKNYFNPEDVAQLNIKAEKLIDKLSKKVAYNTHRLTELELKISSLESILNIRSPKKLGSEDINVEQLKEALENVLSKKVWNITTIEDVLNDLAKFSVELVNKIGRRLIKDVLYRVILQARLCNHLRSELFVAKAKVLRYELNLAS